MSQDNQNKYLASVVRMFISGNYGSERSKSLLQKKAEALGLSDEVAAELEKEKINTLNQAISYLKELCDDADEIDEIIVEEFSEYCQDINLIKEETDLLLKNFQTINSADNDKKIEEKIIDENSENNTLLVSDTNTPEISSDENEFTTWDIDGYVIAVDNNYTIDNYFTEFNSILSEYLQGVSDNFNKFNSINDLKNGALTNLFKTMIQKPIISLCNRALEVQCFEIDQNVIFKHMKDEFNEIREIENLIIKVQKEIKIALQEQKGSSGSRTTMAFGSVGFMVGAAAVSGVSKIFGGVGNLIREHQYKSEIEERIFLELAPKIEDIEYKIADKLVIAYNIIHSAGDDFQLLLDRYKNSQTIANNLYKATLSKEEKISHILDQLQKFAFNQKLWIQLADSFNDLSTKNKIINIAKQCDKYHEYDYDLYWAKQENPTLQLPYDIFADDLEQVSPITCNKVKKLLIAINYQINNSDFQNLPEGFELLLNMINNLNFDFDKYETFLYTLKIISTYYDNYLLYNTLIEHDFDTTYNLSIFNLDSAIQDEINNKINKLINNIPNEIKELLYEKLADEYEADEVDENENNNKLLQINYKIFADIDENYLNSKEKQSLLKELIESNSDLLEYKRYYALAMAENNDFQTALEFSDFLTNHELSNKNFEELLNYISEKHAATYTFIDNCNKFRQLSFYNELMNNKKLEINTAIHICNFIFLHKYYQLGPTVSSFISQNKIQTISASILSLLMFFESSEQNDKLGVIQLFNVFHLNTLQETFDSSPYKQELPDYAPITNEAYFTLLKKDLANIAITSIDDTFNLLHKFFLIINNKEKKESIELIDNIIPHLPCTKPQLLICKIQLLQDSEEEAVSILNDLLLQGMTFNHMKTLCPHITFEDIYQQTKANLVENIKNLLSTPINTLINDIQTLELASLLYIYHNKFDRVNEYIEKINKNNFDSDNSEPKLLIQNTDIISYLISDDTAILLTLSHIYYFAKDTIERIPYKNITEVKDSGFLSTYVKLYFNDKKYKELKVTNTYAGAGVRDFIEVITELVSFWEDLYNNFAEDYNFISLDSFAPEIFTLKDYPHQILEFNKLSREERQDLLKNSKPPRTKEENRSLPQNNVSDEEQEENEALSRTMPTENDNSYNTVTYDTSVFYTNKDQSIFFRENMNDEKLDNFINALQQKHKKIIQDYEVLCLYDETVFGAADKGVAVTADHIYYSIDLLGESEIIKISDIGQITISGLLNKKITITGACGKHTFTLTQGNKGAAMLVDFINFLVDSKQ